MTVQTAQLNRSSRPSSAIQAKENLPFDEAKRLRMRGAACEGARADDAVAALTVAEWAAGALASQPIPMGDRWA